MFFVCRASGIENWAVAWLIQFLACCACDGKTPELPFVVDLQVAAGHRDIRLHTMIVIGIPIASLSSVRWSIPGSGLDKLLACRSSHCLLAPRPIPNLDLESPGWPGLSQQPSCCEDGAAASPPCDLMLLELCFNAELSLPSCCCELDRSKFSKFDRASYMSFSRASSSCNGCSVHPTFFQDACMPAVLQ